MKPHQRIIAAMILVVGWIASIAFARAFLAPEVGAATVAQLNNSNTAYALATGFASAASLPTTIISVIFAVAIFLVLRSKK